MANRHTNEMTQNIPTKLDAVAAPKQLVLDFEFLISQVQASAIVGKDVATLQWWYQTDTKTLEPVSRNGEVMYRKSIVEEFRDAQPASSCPKHMIEDDAN